MSKDKEIKYTSLFLRAQINAVDMFIVAIIRIIFAQIVGILWVNKEMMKFINEFNDKFGVEFSNINAEHVQFLGSHRIVMVAIIFLFSIILVGALYHAFLNSSSWGATIGKRLFKVIVIKNEGTFLSFWQALSHYFLSIVPWVFLIYIISYQAQNKVTIFQAFSNNLTNLIIGIILFSWIQVQIITKKKNTFQDLLMDCSMIKGKIGQGWPKFNKKLR